jgi:predicted nucleotidyltransferase
MKTELPEKSRSHQENIDVIRDVILENYKDKIAFIILFGSFARGDWVYDHYVENHTTYEYCSDYDFLVITKKNNFNDGYKSDRLLHKLSHLRWQPIS